MMLLDGLKAAYRRGVEMRPGDPARLDDFDMIDVGDLLVAVLEETHPIANAPTPKYNRVAYEKWQFETEEIRRKVWEAFDAGLRNKALKLPLEATVAA